MRNLRLAVLVAAALGGIVWLEEATAAQGAKGTPAPAAKPAAAQPAQPAKPATPPATGAEALAQRLAVLRRKVLREEDFAENDDTNRDPFRSYLETWIERGPRATAAVVSAIFSKYSLEELTLIAVVSGDANPRAMFRDPTGLGQTVKRGDYIGKSAARITKILSDRVVLEMSEITPGGTTKALERAVLVNPEGTDQ
ncbi:MAG: pilus assembly protein PilP [Deltaproteobacteria bacterium]|jgi:Tfp pilus assembly protein PilP|nr:pilus assembly protein PilP [Deltaproteobacteria bacterium]